MYGANSRRKTESGFSIVELAIVITVLLIILAITVPGYKAVLRMAHEDALATDLQAMRKAIDQYAADKERAPKTLEDLVTERYLPRIPEDPFTESADTWEVILEDEAIARDGERGIQDVKSGSQDVDSTGRRRYSDW